MEPELFLLEMSESEECKKIEYKCLSIRMPIGLYYSMKQERGIIEPFMIPFRNYIIEKISEQSINVNELLKYMIENDKSNSSLFLASTLFKPKDRLSFLEFMSIIWSNISRKKMMPFIPKIKSFIKRLKSLNSLNVFSVKKKYQSLLIQQKKQNRLKENQNLKNMKGIDK